MGDGGANEAESKDDASVLLKRAAQHRELEEYGKAQERLDKILLDDPENFLAWYEKSKLPIVQEDTVTIKGRSVSLPQYQALPLAEKSDYLQRRGFDVPEIPEIQERLKTPCLIADERIMYLKMAVSYAPDGVKSGYADELNGLVAAKTAKYRRYRNAAVTVGLIALAASVFAALTLCAFSGSALFQRPLSIIAVLIVPYAVSVTGMTLYSRAKNSGGKTTAGFVSNLLALIICNLSIIGTVIFYIV